jgi:hypothetical protein
MAVDHARQDVQAAAIDHLAGIAAQVAERRKPAIGDADIARPRAVVIDDGAALEDQVIGCSDRSLPPSERPRPDQNEGISSLTMLLL